MVSLLSESMQSSLILAAESLSWQKAMNFMLKLGGKW